MKEKNKKSTYVLLGVLSVMVVGLSVAFAALSATLTIKFGNVTQSAETWNVGFKPEATVAATQTTTSQTGYACGNAAVTEDTVTIADTKLSKPGDKCVWPVTIQNKGTIDASLSTITPTAPTGTGVTCTTSGSSIVCGNVTYKLSTATDGKTLLATGGTLTNTNGTLPVYVVAEYTGEALSANEVIQTGAAFTLVYSQK